jgi:hypothetical protein
MSMEKRLKEEDHCREEVEKLRSGMTAKNHSICLSSGFYLSFYNPQAVHFAFSESISLNLRNEIKNIYANPYIILFLAYIVNLSNFCDNVTIHGNISLI